MSSNPYQWTASSSFNRSSYDLSPDRYIMVNIWTAADDKHIPGSNLGHVSIQTGRGAYYSLWPAPRSASEHISRSDLSKTERMARDLGKHFARRPPLYIQNYTMDCLLEGASEGHILTYEKNKEVPDYQLVIFDEETRLFRAAEIEVSQLELDDNEKLLWIKPVQANVRLVFYSLDIGRVDSEFTVLKSTVGGWSMAGSNLFQQRLGIETKESCASLAYRLLSAGGFQSLLSIPQRTSMCSRTSSFVMPGVLARAAFLAKCKEQTQANTAITLDWHIAGESNLDALRYQFSDLNLSESKNEMQASDADEIIESYPSRLNPEIKFNPKYWVISVVNTRHDTVGKLFGHSAIIVEGIEKGAVYFHNTLFLGFYDLRANLYDNSQSVLDINPKGYISDIRVDERNGYIEDIDYRSFQSFSIAVEVIRAKEMIASIKEDQRITEDAKKGVGQYMPYQLVGINSIFSDAEGGHNCASWCADKLKVAGVGNGMAKKPETLAGGICRIS